MTNTPLVSVIMNCFNGEKFLRGAIDSVYNQTYENWEIIFWDNCSNDNSKAIASSYGSKIKVYSSEMNTTLGKARSSAIKKANGEWIAFLDVDDIWLPEKLQRQLAGLINTQNVLSYAGINEVDENLKIINTLYPKWSSGMQLLNQLKYFEINLVSSMIKRETLMNLGLDFDEKMEASEEYNLFMRLLPHGSVYVCKDILAKYRVYPDSLTYKKIKRWAVERRMTLDQLQEKDPSLENKSEFKYAHQQADYYEACYLMAQKQYRDARNLLKVHKTRVAFTVLSMITFIPSLWRLIHNPKVKKKLTSLIKIN